MNTKPAPRFSVGQLVVSHRDEPAVIRRVIPVDHPGKSHRVQVSWITPGEGNQLVVNGDMDAVAYYEHVFEPVDGFSAAPGWWDFVTGPFIVQTSDGYVGVNDDGVVAGDATILQAFQYMLLVDAADIATTFIEGSVVVVGLGAEA